MEQLAKIVKSKTEATCPGGKFSLLVLSASARFQLGVATGSSVVAALAGQGVPVEDTYAGRILGEWRVNHPAPTSSRRRGSGRR